MDPATFTLIAQRTDKLKSLLTRREDIKRQIDLVIEVGRNQRTDKIDTVVRCSSDFVLPLGISDVVALLEIKLDAIETLIAKQSWVPPAAPEGAGA